jgi:endo-1,3(4)-beta-glucanase
MQKVFLVLFAVLACTLGCSSLGASPGFDADGGVAEGGGDDATAPGPSNDGATGPSQDGTTSDAGSHVEDAGTYDSGPVGPLDSGSPPPFDAAPPPRCSEVDASWVPDAGISTAGWTATATATATTDTNRGDFVVANAFDGDPMTRWSSGAAQAGGEGFRLDLGQVQTISQVVFFDESDFPDEYTLALSSDDVNYAVVATGLGAQPTAICFPAQPARYIKILQTGASGSWFSIYEINVFPGGTTSDAGSPDDASADAAPPLVCSEANATWVADAGISTAGWAATASATATTDTNAGDFVAANAFDGTLATRWSTGAGQAGGEWFRLDLGQAQTIGQVVFFDETDYPAEYTLALSSDDLTYTQVATGPGAETTAICFPAQSARYVKITQTGVSSSWFSIYEIDVFPPGSTTSDAGSQLDDAAAGDSGPPDSGPDAAAPGDAGP